jgi:hypothetical protein
MGKTNFTKVEELLDQNLRKISVTHLLDEADKAKGLASSPKKTQELQKQLITSIKRDLSGMKKNAEMYDKIGIKHKDLKRLIEHPETLSAEEWESLSQIHKKIAAFKEELKEKLPKIDNESLVESQRKKHLTKRFNVNDKWLPLT